MHLTLGFSPCPNDTFIFDAMVNGKIDTHGLTFDYVMEDVATLNQWAKEEKLDITKLSYSTFLELAHVYALFNSGSALGKGVGPLLVATKEIDPSEFKNARIAIPGFNTTANLLFTLAHPEATLKTELIFSEIENAVLDGRFDIGLVIHESRFTYASRGLVKLMDMGDWWEKTTQAAIPLGGIVMRRNFDRELIATVDKIIYESIAYAWKQYPALNPFITENAQEMEENVMRQHIKLYVNEFSSDLGTIGRNAIQTLFKRAFQAGLLSRGLPAQIFY